MRPEKYTQFYSDYEQGTVLRPMGHAASFRFVYEAKENTKVRLFAVGETDMFYLWKDEPDLPTIYRSIVDSLDSEHAHRDHYCVDLSSKRPEKYIRRMHKKVLWPPKLSYLMMHPVAEEYRCGLWVKTEGLRIEEGGWLRMRVDIRWKHEGVNPHSCVLPPDETYVIDIAEGTAEWTKLEMPLHIDAEKTCAVLVWIEGVGYSGNVYVEHAFLTASSGENLLPMFDISYPDKEWFDWTGQYLSKREWPEFLVTLNGQEVFRGERFERCHLDSDWSIDLPTALLQRENTLEISLISEYHDAIPYIVHELGIVEQPAGELALLAVDEAGSVQQGVHVLLRTEKANQTVRFTSSDGLLNGDAELHFVEPGLHGVTLYADAPCEGAEFRFETENGCVTGKTGVILSKEEDTVVTGTGDMIYIEQDAAYVEEYLSWYIGHHIGNLLTIRPTYRWSGTRTLDPEVWKTVTRVLNEMGIRYALMVDGRELPGINTNPDNEMLAGKGYLGRQNHERDGAAFYWGGRGGKVSMHTEQYGDMTQEAWKEDPEHTNPDHGPQDYYWRGDDLYMYRAPDIPRDYREGALGSVHALAIKRGNAARHTGPSVMFKYLLQAGYSWVGAETMYGSMEPLMAFQRGAVDAVGSKDIGVHHAVQWSSSPQDVPEHFRRYRLALYVSYMQGATEINTEEGLWHLEEYYSHFHRFSNGCIGHRDQQTDFYRYVASHSRTGRFYAPVALLHGRYDGWHAFGNYAPWGFEEKTCTAAENSWDLLKVIYPNSKPGDALYLHGCATDHAVGYHTGTPLGNVDVIPVEGPQEQKAKYRAAVFLGYNCMEDADADQLIAYVENGGILLMTRAHATKTTDFASVESGKLEPSAFDLRFTNGIPAEKSAHKDGKPLTVYANTANGAEILATTDEGDPLVCRYVIGAGSLILFNTQAYPSEPAIRSLYEETLRDITAKETGKEYIWCETGDDVQFAVYNQEEGGRHIYLLAVDWYRPDDKRRSAVLRIGNTKYMVDIPFGTMYKIVTNGDTAVWCATEQGEVLRVGNGCALVQGTGKTQFVVAFAGNVYTIEVDFAHGVQQEIRF